MLLYELAWHEIYDRIRIFFLPIIRRISEKSKQKRYSTYMLSNFYSKYSDTLYDLYLLSFMHHVRQQHFSYF